MANWCENTIKIETEDKELIEKIRNDMKSDLFCFDFNKLTPMPKNVKHFRDWAGKKWGSFICDDDSEYLGDGSWHVTTAWCPPYKVLEELSKKYGCTVTDTYLIVNMGCGKLTVENGKIVDDEEYEEVEEKVEGTPIVRVHIVPKKR